MSVLRCRSLTNFIGNAVVTLVVARWEKAVDIEQLRTTLEKAGAPAQAEIERIQLRRG